MIIKHSVTAILSIYCLAQSANTCAINLSTAINKTLDSHPQLQADMHRYQASSESVDIVKSEYLPNLDLRVAAGYQRLDTPATRNSTLVSNDHEQSIRENSLTLKQNLFNGMATTNGVKKSLAQRDSVREQLRDKAENIALEVAEVYLLVLDATQQQKLATRNLNMHEKIFHLVSQRTEKGFTNQSDLLQARGRVARARANLVNADSNLRNAKTRFFRLVDQTPDNLEFPAVDDLFLPDTLSKAMDTAMLEHPVIHATEQEYQASTFSYKQSKSEFLPKIDFTLSKHWDRDIQGIPGKYDDSTAVISMTYNLFRGGADSARQQQAAYQQEESRARTCDSKNFVAENLKLNWSAMRSHSEEAPFLKEHMDASGKTVALYQQQFNLGRRSLLDLLDSENESFQAQRAYITNKHQLALSRYKVLNAVGQLLDKIGINLTECWQKKKIKARA
ncbi:hypothetical protein EOPP23_17160 [Endozoicomonas sp. OPT23]|uniref:TolC family outer membrane protein n=1 Tax=Endozoicomonas sp. OPT23 TaxID=2072845 RepID=UPI00129A403E|nr:TolC family outer membrane protein [Endozoicomonas sp. OPT23]MRI34714.1 hypothetical protein [Endozoicomonas sp. OPT23]